MKWKCIISLLVLIACGIQMAKAQTGSITGRVVDENGEGIPFANVVSYDSANVMVNGTATDFNGYFILRPLYPGIYVLTTSYIGSVSNIHGIRVNHDTIVAIDDILVDTSWYIGQYCPYYNICFPSPIDHGNPSFTQTMTARMGFYGRR